MTGSAKSISVLMATAFIDMLGFAMVFPLLPFYALKLKAEPWAIGWMIASFSIAQLASAPLWGRVSDRYGRRPALLVGLGASAVAFVVFAFADRVWMLFLSRLVQGAGGGTTGVAQAYVGDAIEPGERAMALGWLSAATSAGVMLGPVTGSLATRLGPAAPGLFAACLCVVNVAFAARWLPEPGRGPRHAARDGQVPATTTAAPAVPAVSAAPAVQAAPRAIREVVLDVFRAPRAGVAPFIWIYAVGMLGFASMTSVLGLYLKTRFGVTENTIGYFFLWTGSLSLVMRGALLGRIVARFGEARVMRLGAALLALGLAAVTLPGELLGFALALSLVPIGTACLFPATSALVTRRARKAELGQTMGVQQSFGGVARIVAPIGATAAFQKLGPSVPFFIASGVVAVAFVLTGSRRDAEAGPS